MACGLDAEACIIEHWMPTLVGHRERATWRAPCPLCDARRDPLSIWVQGESVRWSRHCKCDKDEVRVKLAEMLPGCVSARYVPRHAAAKDLIELALADIPPQSLRLGLLELAGVPTGEALAKLGIGPTHKNRVLAPLRKLGRLPVAVRNRRSHPLPVSVSRDLPVSVRNGRSSDD